MKRLKAVTTVSVFVLITYLSCKFLGGGDISQAEANRRMEQWYTEQGNRYNLNLSDKQVELKVTRYFPAYSPKEKNDMITAKYQGMTITIMFNKPLADIERTKAAFQENFQYVTLDDIYSTVDVPGWNVHPRTPESSNSKPSTIQFTKVTDTELAFQVNWEIYTVFGYSTNQFCQDELQMTVDKPTPEECMASFRKRIPIQVNVDAAF